ncbi:hypothetical protein [Methylorubrum sp. DB1722]|uniref:hypothetical protein n=1 Tax=Methylorubrum sp. DB1722 TaxID=2478916 RepID=UPI0018E3E53D|nr:hypothetical protein [Methylorubrum sp. DB1722]
MDDLWSGLGMLGMFAGLALIWWASEVGEARKIEAQARLLEAENARAALAEREKGDA